MADPIRTMLNNFKDRYYRERPPDGQLAFPALSSGQTGTRGLMMPIIEAGRQVPLDRSVIFQFNPAEVFYRKDMRWATLERTGFPHDIPYWVGGGARTISFRLFMDATAGSNYRIYRNNQSTDVNHNPTGGAYINFDDYYLSGNVEGSLGLLPEWEKLEAMRYPVNKTANDLIIFRNGLPDVTTAKKFANPPFVVFSYGNVAAMTYVIALERRDMLFNRTLNPIRMEVDVILGVLESRVVDTNIIIKPNLKPAPETVNDTRRFL